VHKKGIAVDKAKVDLTSNMPVQSSMKQIKSDLFLAMLVSRGDRFK